MNEDRMLAVAGVHLLDDFAASTEAASLAPILPHFFVPPLADKPQNPIMDTIKLISTNRQKPAYPQNLPHKLSLLALNQPDATEPTRPKSPLRDMWLDAATRNIGIRVCVAFIWNCIPNRLTKKVTAEQSSFMGSSKVHSPH
jgi:hypothetical protein